MFSPGAMDASNKVQFYLQLEQDVRVMMDRFWFTNLANASAILNLHLTEINWVGFYLAQDGELALGPFQGQPACLRIPFGKGVCGSAALQRSSLVVPDVDAFPGHIACDSRSRSEIVVPILSAGRLLGVLDVDSPLINRFDEQDRIGLERVVKVLVESTDWPARF